MTHLTLDGLGGQGSPTTYHQEWAVEEEAAEEEMAEEEEAEEGVVEGVVTQKITMTRYLGPS